MAYLSHAAIVWPILPAVRLRPSVAHWRGFSFQAKAALRGRLPSLARPRRRASPKKGVTAAVCRSRDGSGVFAVILEPSSGCHDRYAGSVELAVRQGHGGGIRQGAPSGGLDYRWRLVGTGFIPSGSGGSADSSVAGSAAMAAARVATKRPTAVKLTFFVAELTAITGGGGRGRSLVRPHRAPPPEGARCLMGAVVVVGLVARAGRVPCGTTRRCAATIRRFGPRSSCRRSDPTALPAW